jgi:autotransporter adhesin
VQITADSKGKVQISLDQPETDKVEGTVQATDANGRVVYSGVLEGQMTLLELNVPSGVYYLTVQRGNTIEKKKVFIQD